MTGSDGLPEPDTAASRGAGSEKSLEDYVVGLFAKEDEHLLRIRRAMDRAELPTIQLPAATGRALQLLLRAIGARRVVEVGTLAGYSALWIARGLRDDLEPGEGGLVSIEIDSDRAALARDLLSQTEVAHRIEVREGDAAALLEEMAPDGSLDAVFLDADKEGLPRYVHHARRLLRPGGLLCVDNALWRGQVADDSANDAATAAIRRSHEMIAEDPAFDATILPVGDGLLVGLRRA